MIVTQYDVGPGAYGVVAAADGTTWTSLVERGELACVSPGGQVSRVRLEAGQSRPMVLTCGPDGAIWFSRGDGRIGRIDPAGTVSSVPVATPAGSPYGLCAGPDRTLWYTLLAADRVGRISLDGGTEEFSLAAGSMPSLITAGPDGALWCTLNRVGAIARITPDGAATIYRCRRRMRPQSASTRAARLYGSPRSAPARSGASALTGGSRNSRFPTAPAARTRSPPRRTGAAGLRCGPPAPSSGSTATAA